MKKVIYAISITVIAATVIFYFNIAGRNDDGMSVTKSGENIQASELQPEKNNINSYSPSQSSLRSGGWVLQLMPNMGSRLVRDLYFTDSLTGYAVASPDIVTDSAHILKTTNGGNNWSIKYTAPGRLSRIKFLNTNIGFAGGNKLLKTTNAGINWDIMNKVFGTIANDMFIFGEDTLWYGDSDPLSGGLFCTTNGGINWEKRDSGIPANSYPFYIYFYNSRIGFATGGTNVYKTTDAGLSWSFAFSGGAQKLYFRDSLNGYRTSQGFFRTTNGGLNWSKDSLPNIQGNTYTMKSVITFNPINNDTIYCTGGAVYYYSNSLYRATLYKTTNGGLNWGYQIPDTSYRISQLNVIGNFQKYIWSVDNFDNRLIYPSTGGDSTIYVGVQNLSCEVPAIYELYQNYPNPFNSMTNFKFQILKSEQVKLSIYDITGKEVAVTVNEKLKRGTYETRFDGSGLSSGVYFYRLTAVNNAVQTRKMVLLK